MSVNPASDLIAGLFAETTPAKAAISAKTKGPRGFRAVPTVCESLRTAANSQAFAADRKTPNGPESEAGRGFSQKSRLSQGVSAQLAFVAWTDRDIERFGYYRQIALRAGFSEPKADDIAETLVMRDRGRCDRRMCLECAELQSNGRCRAAARGAIDGAGRFLEPVQSILQRCESFRPSGSCPKEGTCS